MQLETPRIGLRTFFPRHARVNIEFGQANHVAFSPDGK